MKLTWLGHACFVLEHEGFRYVADPYTRVEGYPEMHATANAVTCSHHHFDHDAVHNVTLEQGGNDPFTVEKVDVFHDEAGGTLRGTNTIHIFSAGGQRVAHLGDLGHALTEEQVAAAGKLDAILIPVGGFFTVEPPIAKQVCEQLKPRIIIPMHYRHAPYGLTKVGGVDAFLDLWDKEIIHLLDTNTLELTDNMSGIWVPAYQE